MIFYIRDFVFFFYVEELIILNFIKIKFEIVLNRCWGLENDYSAFSFGWSLSLSAFCSAFLLLIV